MASSDAAASDDAVGPEDSQAAPEMSEIDEETATATPVRSTAGDQAIHRVQMQVTNLLERTASVESKVDQLLFFMMSSQPHHLIEPHHDLHSNAHLEEHHELVHLESGYHPPAAPQQIVFHTPGETRRSPRCMRAANSAGDERYSSPMDVPQSTNAHRAVSAAEAEPDRSSTSGIEVMPAMQALPEPSNPTDGRPVQSQWHPETVPTSTKRNGSASFIANSGKQVTGKLQASNAAASSDQSTPATLEEFVVKVINAARKEEAAWERHFKWETTHHARWVVMPSSGGKQVWDVFVSAVATVFSLLVTYHLGFARDRQDTNLLAVLIACDAIAWLDIVVNCRTAARQPEPNQNPTIVPARAPSPTPRCQPPPCADQGAG